MLTLQIIQDLGGELVILSCLVFTQLKPPAPNKGFLFRFQEEVVNQPTHHSLSSAVLFVLSSHLTQ